MCYRKLGTALLCLMLLQLFVPAQPLYAAPRQGDELVFGDDLTLGEGERIDGDLVMFGGNLTMRQGSRVEGSVTVFGGRAEIDGTVRGEVVAFGGNLVLGTHARVGGEVVAIGSRVERAEGAETGNVVQGFTLDRAEFWRQLRLPFLSLRFGSRSNIWNTLFTLFFALFAGLLGVLIVNVWPEQSAQVRLTILTAPWPSLIVGFLLYPLAGSLSLFLLITVCLAPFVPVVVIVLVAASLFGWVALGTLWGRWLMRLFKARRATPAMVTGIGVFTLSLVAAAIGAFPCLGPLLSLAMSGIGLGAVVLSRFGTTNYGKTPAQIEPVPPADV